MHSKDVGLRIRVEKELRADFQRACDEDERAASEVIRQFMREFVEQHANRRQQSLFAEQHKPENSQQRNT